MCDKLNNVILCSVLLKSCCLYTRFVQLSLESIYAALSSNFLFVPPSHRWNLRYTTYSSQIGRTSTFQKDTQTKTRATISIRFATPSLCVQLAASFERQSLSCSHSLQPFRSHFFGLQQGPVYRTEIGVDLKSRERQTSA